VTCLTDPRASGSVLQQPADAFEMCVSLRAPRGRAQARGSSLIELVVLFSLVGMVSAFAIPRYTHLANQARATQVIALSGILRGVAKSAHQQYVESGNTLAAATLEGKAVSLKNGYPDASTSGIRAVMIDWAGFTTKATPNSVTFMKKGATNAEQCAVVYSIAEAQSSAALTHLAVGGC
jgi:MSHA pilin protein MshA